MSILYIFAWIVAILGILTLLTYLLPRKVVVVRQGEVPFSAEDVIARAASTSGFQSFNPYAQKDPNLKITSFGPEAGWWAGWRAWHLARTLLGRKLAVCQSLRHCRDPDVDSVDFPTNALRSADTAVLALPDAHGANATALDDWAAHF